MVAADGRRSTAADASGRHLLAARRRCTGGRPSVSGVAALSPIGFGAPASRAGLAAVPRGGGRCGSRESRVLGCDRPHQSDLQSTLWLVLGQVRIPAQIGAPSLTQCEPGCAGRGASDLADDPPCQGSPRGLPGRPSSLTNPRQRLGGPGYHVRLRHRPIQTCGRMASGTQGEVSRHNRSPNRRDSAVSRWAIRTSRWWHL